MRVTLPPAKKPWNSKQHGARSHLNAVCFSSFPPASVSLSWLPPALAAWRLSVSTHIETLNMPARHDSAHTAPGSGDRKKKSKPEKPALAPLSGADCRTTRRDELHHVAARQYPQATNSDFLVWSCIGRGRQARLPSYSAVRLVVSAIKWMSWYSVDHLFWPSSIPVL